MAPPNELARQLVAARLVSIGRGLDPSIATSSVTPGSRDANLRALSGRMCPRPDQAFLQRLIDYGIATGYLRGERFSVRRGSAAPALCESRAPSVLRP